MADNKYLIRPQDQNFWIITAMTLKPFGLGDREWWGLPQQHVIYSIIGTVTSIFGPLSLVSLIWYFAVHHSEYPFFQLGNLFTVIMVTFIVVTKLMCARKASYERILRKFMTDIHIYYYKPRNPFCDELLVKIEKYTRVSSITIMLLIGGDWVFWLTVPVINNILTGAYTSNGTVRLQTCMYMTMPFDYEHSIQNWMVMHVISMYVAGVGCSLFAISDTIMLSIIYHLIGRIKILKHNLEDLSLNLSYYSDEDIRGKLGICVRDHVLIKHCFNEMQDAFGLSVTGYYAFNLIFDSLLIIELKYGDTSIKVAYIFMVFLYVGGLICLSLVMEEIRNQGGTLPDAVYAIPWERMSVTNQRIALVLLGRVQTILVFKAFAGLEAGVRPTISIMKSTFSYYVMLKSKSEGMGK